MHGNQCVTDEKLTKTFLSTVCPVGLKSGLCNSPGVALQDGVSSMVIHPPVPDISGGTDRHTHTHAQNMRIII